MEDQEKPVNQDNFNIIDNSLTYIITGILRKHLNLRLGEDSYPPLDDSHNKNKPHEGEKL